MASFNAWKICEISVETMGNVISSHCSLMSGGDTSAVRDGLFTKLLVVRRHTSLMAKGELAKMFPSKKHREWVILSPDILPFCIHINSAYISLGWWLLSSDAARFPFLVSPFASHCSTEHRCSMIYAWLRLSLCFQMPTWGLWLTLPCGSCLMALWCSSAYAEHLDISTDRGISWGSLCISDGEWGSAEPYQMPWGAGLGLLYCV